MYYEKLALEVGATVAGFNVVKPPLLEGESGVEHKFTFVATDGDVAYAFDVYPEVGQVEILRAYVKKMDTGARTYVVCLSGRPTPEASGLARIYDVGILGPKEVGDFFSSKIVQKMRPTSSMRTAA